MIYVILAMKEIRAGGDQLAAGNLDYQVPTNRLYGEFRKHGENLNNLRGGIQHAVEEQMKSERMKTELITNVSHDIKTPLTSIISYTQLLRQQALDPPEANDYVTIIDQKSQRLKSLVQDIFDLSKATSATWNCSWPPWTSASCWSRRAWTCWTSPVASAGPTGAAARSRAISAIGARQLPCPIC